MNNSPERERPLPRIEDLTPPPSNEPWSPSGEFDTRPAPEKKRFDLKGERSMPRSKLDDSLRAAKVDQDIPLGPEDLGKLRAEIEKIHTNNEAQSSRGHELS